MAVVSTSALDWLQTTAVSPTDIDGGASAVVRDSPCIVRMSVCQMYVASREDVWKGATAGEDLDAVCLAELSDEVRFALYHRAVSACPPGAHFYSHIAHCCLSFALSTHLPDRSARHTCHARMGRQYEYLPRDERGYSLTCGLRADQQ